MSYNETPMKGTDMNLEEKTVVAKNHIRRNRAKYAAGATFVASLALHYRIASSWNDYLRDQGLLQDFYKEY